MNKAKGYLRGYVDANASEELIEKLCKMQNYALKDVKELIEKRLDDPPEYLTGDEIHQLEWVIGELEKLKI